MQSIDCLFIGSATQDVFLLVNEAPASDQRIAAKQLAYACGGIAATAASAYQKLGGRAGLITAVGKDEAGAFIREALEARALSFLQLLTLPNEASPFSAILVERNGKRMIAHYGGCMQRLRREMLDNEAFVAAKAIHLGGLSEPLAVELATYLRKATNAVLSLDGGNYSREAIDEMLPHLDVFIPDDKTVARTLGLEPEAACRYYHEKGAGMVCVTLGSEGAIAFDGEDFYREPSAPDINPIDTTGAGDNFHGAFLYCLQQGFDLQKTLRFCNTFAGLCCEGLGGTAAEPTLRLTLSRMRKSSK